MLEANLRKELVIQTENRVGLLAEVTRRLSDMGISLLAVAARPEDSGAVLHLITNTQLYARDALRSAGFSVQEREVIVLNLSNHPGFLCRVAEALARKDLAIEELYVTVSEGSAKGLVVFTTSHNSKAVQMLRGH